MYRPAPARTILSAAERESILAAVRIPGLVEADRIIRDESLPMADRAAALRAYLLSTGGDSEWADLWDNDWAMVAEWSC